MSDLDKASAKLKVLIIEDDPLISGILSFKFLKAEWDVLGAPDGEVGLQKAEENPNLIILDILLPGISGYEILEKLKTNELTSSIPVLVFSNYGQKEEIEKSISLGAVDHLVKANAGIDDVVKLAEDIVNNEYVRKQ